MDIISGSQNNISSNVRYVRNERMAGFVPSYGADSDLKNNDNSSISQSFAIQTEAPEIGYKQESDDGFSFFDLLDIINPFQHIPLVNIAYRALTGDEIKPMSQIVGGAVFGGPLGAAGGLVNAVIEEETGGDIVENALSLVRSPKPFSG